MQMVRALAALLLLPALGYGQELTMKVTFDCPAMPAAKALAALSQTMGVPLSAANQTADEIVTFRFKGVPAAQALRKIADTMDAQWKPEGAGYRLVRPVELLDAERKREFDTIAAGYARAIAKRKEGLAKMKPFDETEAKRLAGELETALRRFNPRQGNDFEKVDRQGPGGRAITRIVANLTPEELASVPPRIKIVFSNKPTPMQYPLNPQASAAVAQYLRDQAVWADVAERRAFKRPTFGGAQYWMGNLGENTTAPGAGQVGKVLLTAFSYGRGNGVQFELLVADQKGKVIGRSSDNLTPEREDRPQPPKPPTPKPGEPTLKISAEAQELVPSYTERGPQNKPLSPELVAKLTNPEKVDPLSLTTSDLLQQCATLKKENLVAVLPDGMMYGGFDPKKPPTPDAYLQIVGSWLANVQEKDGWITVQPKEPARERASRVNRRVLGDYLRFMAAHRQPTLEDKAVFALLLPDPQDNSMPMYLAQRLQNNNEYWSDDMLKFYGVLSPAQRKQATTPQGLSLSVLTAEQMAYLNPMIYGNNSNLQYEPDRDERGNQNYDPEMNELFWNGLMREPTESLPNGVPNSGVLKLTVDDQSAAFPDPNAVKESYLAEQPLTADDIAQRKFAKVRPDIFSYMLDNEYYQTPLDRLRLGSRRSLQFRFELTKNLSFYQSLQENRPPDGPAVAYNDLPADFRKQIDDKVAEMTKSYAGIKPQPITRTGGGASPAP